MHGAELPYQVIKKLPAHSLLGGWDSQEAAQILELALWERDCNFLGGDDPPEDLLYARPIHVVVQRQAQEEGCAREESSARMKTIKRYACARKSARA